jgi:hypothetical protein
MSNFGRTALMAGLLGLVALVAGAQASDVSSHPMIGDAAPCFDLKEAGGGTLSLESLKGRYVVLHFGASW